MNGDRGVYDRGLDGLFLDYGLNGLEIELESNLTTDGNES